MRATSFTSNSKKYGLKAAAYVAVFSICFIAISGIYQKANSKNKINVWSQQRFTDFYALEKDSIDMMFVGSSHSYCTFDPEVVNGVLGIKSYQMGMPEQNADGTYYTLLDILEIQKPKTVVMDILWSALDKDFYYKQADLLFQVMDNNSLKNQYILSVLPVSEKLKYFIIPVRYQQDFISYADKYLTTVINDRYGISKASETSAAEIVTGSEYYRSLGFIYCDYVITDESYDNAMKYPPDGKDYPIANVQKKYLEKIVRLCEENDIELIFTSAPAVAAVTGSMANYDLIHNEIAEFAAKYNIPYLDYNYGDTADGLFERSDFRDANHLNCFGAVKASEFFAGWYEAHGGKMQEMALMHETGG